MGFCGALSFRIKPQIRPHLPIPGKSNWKVLMVVESCSSSPLSRYRPTTACKSCCINHGPSQWERATFDPHSSETPWPTFMKLDPDTIPHAKFQGDTLTWVVWANSRFDAWKFLFFISSSRPQVAFLDTPPRTIRRSRQRNTFLGLERRKLKFDPFTSKKRKNLDFKLAVNGKL